jgi:nucleoside-diphosphate-sugar epimerase
MSNATQTLTHWPALHGDAFAGRRVCVTGGAGFIGSHLVAALLALGAKVSVIDDLSEGSEDNLAAIGATDRVSLVRGTILDVDAVKRAADGAELVFHLAALVSVPRSVKEPRLNHDINCTGTMNVLLAARDAGAKRVMFSASSSAYGNSEVLPKVEMMTELPMSPYAATKLAGEQYVRSFANCYPLDAVSLRYFNIFGPRQKANSAYAGVVAAFASTLLKGVAPTIHGDGTASRDFTFVHNAVHANLLAARRERPFKGMTINVATGQRLTVKDLAVTMARLLGREDLQPKFGPPRPGDVMHSQADLTRAKAELGYEPIVSFEQGLGATLEWYRTQA